MASDGIEEFSAERNLARVSAGFKGSEWFKGGIPFPHAPFVDGWPVEVAEKFDAPQSLSQPTPTDPWVDRRK